MPERKFNENETKIIGCLKKLQRKSNNTYNLNFEGITQSQIRKLTGVSVSYYIKNLIKFEKLEYAHKSINPSLHRYRLSRVFIQQRRKLSN